MDLIYVVKQTAKMKAAHKFQLEVFDTRENADKFIEENNKHGITWTVFTEKEAMNKIMSEVDNNGTDGLVDYIDDDVKKISVRELLLDEENMPWTQRSTDGEDDMLYLPCSITKRPYNWEKDNGEYIYDVCSLEAEEEDDEDAYEFVESLELIGDYILANIYMSLINK